MHCLEIVSCIHLSFWDPLINPIPKIAVSLNIQISIKLQATKTKVPYTGGLKQQKLIVSVPVARSLKSKCW